MEVPLGGGGSDGWRGEPGTETSKVRRWQLLALTREALTNRAAQHGPIIILQPRGVSREAHLPRRHGVRRRQLTSQQPLEKEPANDSGWIGSLSKRSRGISPSSQLPLPSSPTQVQAGSPGTALADDDLGYECCRCLARDTEFSLIVHTTRRSTVARQNILYERRASPSKGSASFVLQHTALAAQQPVP